MFNNNKRMFNPNQYYQNQYNPMEYQNINPYDLSRYDEQINDLKRINNELLKRINRIENYLVIKKESDSSNY